MKASPHLPKLACCWQVYWLSGGASLQVGTGVAAAVAAGVATGLAPGVGLATAVAAGVTTGFVRGLVPGIGLAVAAGARLGDVPAGQRLQVTAQYPPAGEPAVNIKASPHLPKLACCWQVYWLSGGISLQLGTGVAAEVAAGAEVGKGIGEGVVVPVGLVLGEVPAGVETGEGLLAGAGEGLVAGEREGIVAGETEGLEVGDGEGLAAGEEGLETGEVPERQRPQVAAQYPPAGAPAANMKSALHLPKLCCCWQV